MSDGKHERSDEYGKARSAFDGLSMDERASFLVESVVAMMAEGVGQAGKVVSSVLDDLAEKLDDLAGEEESAAEEPAAKKPAAKKTAAKPAAKTSSRRKKAGGARKPKSPSDG